MICKPFLYKEFLCCRSNPRLQLLSMTQNYKTGRQSDHLEMGDDEFNRRLGAIADAFGRAWLDSQGGHPLQLLWQRKDGFAVNQLCLLGDAIAGLRPIDPRWVDDQIKKVKGNDTNSRRGAMFELLGVNLFRHKPQTIRPTGRNAPGYDAVLALPDGAEADISLKSYGTSTHEETFRKQAASTEQAFIATMKARQSAGAVLNILANTYPSSADWASLRAALPNIACGQPAQRLGIWAIRMPELPPDYGPYSTNHFSYQAFMFAPFHANESKNLFDKFDDAFVNARKHAATKTNSVRVVLLRVPETISLSVCDRWTKEYIVNNAKGPIDGVYLYQLTVIEKPNDQSLMSHALSISETRNFTAWRSPAGGGQRQMAINLAVGSLTEPTRRQILGGPVPIELDEGYIYQKGDFYTAQKVDPNKPTNGTIRNLASGIFQHAVFEFPDGGSFTLGGHFPPVKEITLFD
jgi:hypothetical protein